MKKWLIFESEVEEILNFNDKLTFILKDSKFLNNENSSFTDIGYIDKYQVINVINYGGNKLHITDQYYFHTDIIAFDDFKVKCKIDLFNRLKIKKSNYFNQIFQNEFEKYFYKKKYTFFATSYYSYFIFDIEDDFEIDNINQILFHIKERIFFPFYILSKFYYENRYFIYFFIDIFFDKIFEINYYDLPFFLWEKRRVYYGNYLYDILNKNIIEIIKNDYDFVFLNIFKEKGFSLIVSKNIFEKVLKEKKVDLKNEFIESINFVEIYPNNIKASQLVKKENEYKYRNESDIINLYTNLLKYLKNIWLSKNLYYLIFLEELLFFLKKLTKIIFKNKK